MKMAALVMERIEADKPVDSIQAAWNFVTGWVASNSAHFTKPDVPVTSLYPPKEVSPAYGHIERGKVYVIATDLNDALSDAGFSYRKCIRGFQRRGLIDTFTDSEGKKRSQTGKVVKGIPTRVYSLNMETTARDDDGIMDDDGAEDDLPPFTELEELLS